MESTSDETIKNMVSKEAEIPNLHVAAANKQIDVIKYLLLVGVDVNLKNDDGLTALQVAVSKSKSDSHYIVCKELIAKGGSVHVQDKNGFSPLHASVKNEKNIQIVELLISEGACVNNKINYEGREGTALHLAAFFSFPEYIELLLCKGALINATDKGGRTPLHWAAIRSKNNSHLAIIRFLLAHNANPNAQDDNKCSPLHLLFFSLNGNMTRGNGQIISLLLDNGADVNLKNTSGLTPLHLATHNNMKHEIELLLLKGAVVDSKDTLYSANPLVHAVLYNVNDSHFEIFKLLIAHHADINNLLKGVTPLEILIRMALEDNINEKTLELFLNNDAEFIEEDTRKDYFKILRQCLIMLLKLIKKIKSDASEQFEKKLEEEIIKIEAKLNTQRNESLEIIEKNKADVLELEKKHEDEIKNLELKFLTQQNRSLKIIEKNNADASEQLEKKHEEELKKIEAKFITQQNKLLKIIEKNNADVVELKKKHEETENLEAKFLSRIKSLLVIII